MRLHHLLDHWLEQNSEQPFIHLPDGSSLSFADLAALTDRAEAELQQLEVRAGDRVLVVAENCPEHAALILACSRVGAWSCGVNARMASGEVDAFVEHADARVVYFSAGSSSQATAHAQRHAAVASTLPGMQHGAVRRQATPEPAPLQGEVAALIFTSGTTGTPKGVMVTHEALLLFARVSAESRQLGPEDRSYAFVPMTHIFGLGTVLLASLHAGAQLVLRSHFDPADLLDALAQHGVTQLQGPPTLYARLLTHLQEQGVVQPEAPQLRYVYTGAGPLDMRLKQQVEQVFGQPLHHGYGLSEYAGSVHLTRMGEWRRDNSSGYVVEGAEVQITDPDSGQPLPAGARGEAWIRGRGLMRGYFRDPESTAAVMRPGGWYASGDLGELHEDGALFVVGRLKEMIIRSGFNVYPAEVELALNACAGVQHSAVVGRPEQDGNEEIIAFVELKPGADFDEAAARAHLREQLAPYKRPAHIVVLPELPTSLNGKLLKRQLQKLALNLERSES